MLLGVGSRASPTQAWGQWVLGMAMLGEKLACVSLLADPHGLGLHREILSVPLWQQTCFMQAVSIAGHLQISFPNYSGVCCHVSLRAAMPACPGSSQDMVNFCSSQEWGVARGPGLFCTTSSHCPGMGEWLPLCLG